MKRQVTVACYTNIAIPTDTINDFKKVVCPTAQQKTILSRVNTDFPAPEYSCNG